MRRTFRVAIVLVLSLTAFRAASAQQWNPIFTLPGGAPGSISALYFLDRFGAPNDGFVGTSYGASGLYRTIDGGTSWLACPNTAGLDIRDFAFKDALTGWAVASNSPTILKTTDGGATWSALAAPNAGTAIRYAARTHTLFISYPILGDAQQSTDDGTTWTQSATQGLNGLAFADSGCGVWSSHGNLAIYWTTNGGTLWQASNLVHHIYSPTSLGTSHCFYALSEFDDSGYLSLDSGRNWIYRGIFLNHGALFNYLGPTGCVEFSNGNLWTQTVYDGMFLSRDTGRTWISLCGPSQDFDSRFYARGAAIFAAEDSELYEDPDGTIPPPPARLGVLPDTLRLEASGCSGTYLTANITLLSGCSAELDSVYLTGPNSFTGDRIDEPILLPATAVNIYYRNRGQPFDTAYLHLVWRTSGSIKDTIIPVYGTIGGAPKTLLVPTLSSSRVIACTNYDTTVLISSLACDTLKILSMSLTDSDFLHLIFLPFPAFLAPNASFPVPLRGRFPHPGQYLDSVHIRFVLNSGGPVIDTVLPISIEVGGVARPIANNLTVRAQKWCETIDTIIQVKNLHCSAGTLDSITTSDSSVVVAENSSFPIALAPDSVVSVPIFIQPGKSGTVLATLTLYFNIDGVRIDTTIFITVETTTESSPTPVLSQSKISFGPSSLCFEKKAALIYSNTECDTLVLAGIRWSYPDSELWFDAASLPVVLPPGATDTIWLHYHPSGNHLASASLDLSFLLGGLRHDTILGVTGIGTDAPTASLRNDTLSFPTITKCEDRLDSTMFINTSCDTLLITNAQDWSPGSYTIVSPGLPVAVAPGDSVTFLVEFAPAGNGLDADSIDIEYRSSGSAGAEPSQRLLLFGSSQTPELPPQLSGADFSGILLPPCSDWDTSFIVRNPNACDTLSLDSISVSDSSFSITSVPALPARLGSDSAVTISIHFVPAHDSDSAALHLFGTNLDTMLRVVILRPNIDSISFTPQVAPVLTTTPCQPGSEMFVLSGGGPCDSVTIDSLLLLPIDHSNPETKFQLTGAPAAPFTLHGTDTLWANYDPNSFGSDSALLVISASARNFSLHLPLVASGSAKLPEARCALAVDGKLRDTVAPGGVATVALRTLDAIPDSLGLTEVSFDLNFDDNLITKLRVNPGAGFVAGAVQPKPGFLSLQFLHTAGAPIAAGDLLGSVDFFVTLGDSSWTPIALANLRFNPQDSNYERCTLSAAAAEDSAYLTISNSCGSPELRQVLETGNLAILGIRPSLVTTGASLSVDLSVRIASTVHCSLFTEDGVELSSMTRALAAGRQTILLELPRVPHGVAFIQIGDAREACVRKIAFE